ncbi:MAG: hypothetical protein HQL15_09330 [Candidatus Omnitrophica bacterium]|nr:hypothetical protein [Candidatus Omnitrophota bacterium]
MSQHLRALLNAGKIVKSGTHPRHIYFINPPKILEVKIRETNQAVTTKMKEFEKTSELKEFADTVKSQMWEDAKKFIENSKGIAEGDQKKMLEVLAKRFGRAL